MHDILQRLRDYAIIQNVTGGYPSDEVNLSSEAADEIERLRGELRWIHDGAHTRAHTLPQIKSRCAYAIGILSSANPVCDCGADEYQQARCPLDQCISKAQDHGTS